MDYYAITINIKLGVLMWKEIYDALLNFFFKVKYIIQNSIFSLRKKREGKGRGVEGRGGKKKRERKRLWAHMHKHTFLYTERV